MPESKRYHYVIAVIILLVAAGVRLWALPTLPIGLSDAEVANVGIVREDIWQGDIRVFYTYPDVTTPYRANTEGMYHMVLATTSLLFGEGTLGLRVLSVFVNMITVALIYSLGKRLFGSIAGLMAAGLYAVMMWSILLSRLVIVEATVPLMVTAVMLAMAQALPVYERVRVETSNTLDFAVMGSLISLSLYLYASSLFVVLMAMAFIVYIIFTQRPISLRRLSYLGFAILMLMIVALPYVISTFRLPDLAASSRIVGADGVNLIANTVNMTLGIFWQGDGNVAYNLPQRPLIDLLSGFVMLLGVVVCVQRWRDIRYALVLIAGLMLALPAILAGSAPNFVGLTTLLPVIVLLFGAGVVQIMRLIPKQWQTGVLGIFALVIAGNLVWSVDSLFNQWHNHEDVYVAYNGDVGSIAHHFDLTADDIPVVICNPEWEPTPILRAPAHDIDLVRLHMNRDMVLIREVDCRNAFVFVNAGAHQQVLVVEPMMLSALSPAVADWLALSTPMPDLPVAMVFDMQVQPELEDALGVFTTTAPASYATDSDIMERVSVAPPIRFGGNVTWLGYEVASETTYQPRMQVPVSTYWRVEGLVPSDLTIFTHLLIDPISPSAQSDRIFANPRHLRERDVYLHDERVTITPNVVEGTHTVSVGVYQQTSGERLAVFLDERETQGDRIFLYPITIELPSDTETEN